MVLVTVLQVLLELVKRFGNMGGNGSSSNCCTRVGTRGEGLSFRWSGTRDGTRVGNRGY